MLFSWTAGCMEERSKGESGENSWKVLWTYISACSTDEEQPSSLAVQGWAYPWMTNEKAHLYSNSDWFSDGHVTQAQPIKAFSRILAKTIRTLALSASVIIGGKDCGSLKLLGALFFTAPLRDDF